MDSIPEEKTNGHEKDTKLNGAHNGGDMSKDLGTTTIASQYGTNIQISGHPVMAHKVAYLRSSSTLPSSFRAVLREITFYLGYEATATLTTRPVSLTVPVGHDHVNATGKKLKERMALIPIMRSGLGMVDSMLELLPNSGVYHIGMYKREHLPVMYYNRLPKKCEVDIAYVLDPVIATATTVQSVVGILKRVSNL